MLKLINQKYEGYVPKFYYGNNYFTVMEKIEESKHLADYILSEELSKKAAEDLLSKMFTLTFEENIYLDDIHTNNIFIKNNEEAILIDTAYYRFFNNPQVFVPTFSNMNEIIINNEGKKINLLELFNEYKKSFNVAYE